MRPEYIAILVLTALSVIGFVGFASTFRSKLVAAKREWLQLSTILTGHSMPHSSKIFECLAVDDFAGAFAECEYLIRELRDPKKAALMLDNVLTGELPLALSDASRQPAIVTALKGWIAANKTAASAAGLTATN